MENSKLFSAAPPHSSNKSGEITIAFGDKMESEKEQGWADKGGGSPSTTRLTKTEGHKKRDHVP